MQEVGLHFEHRNEPLELVELLLRQHPVRSGVEIEDDILSGGIYKEPRGVRHGALTLDLGKFVLV